MNGAALAARYAFPPNRFGYCGTKSFRSVLGAHLSHGGHIKSLESELRNFRVHYAYLRLIARESGRKPFEMEVVRAFWTGNTLLENVSGQALRRFISRDLFEGKHPSRARKLCSTLPDGILPHHSFNSLFVNFVTDRVERSAENFDSCCITAARVLSVGNRRASVTRNSIGHKGGFVFREKKDALGLEHDSVRLAGRIKKGDIVSAHWGMAVEKLSPGNARLLEKYTKRNIEAVNGMR
ncbi:MAG TPA: DUF6390 family protein [Candidatus Bilamarchaeum sp.]|nr:DUF6390 family protein [Candidatus Bilamarchaeum sp.]